MIQITSNFSRMKVHIQNPEILQRPLSQNERVQDIPIDIVGIGKIKTTANSQH